MKRWEYCYISGVTPTTDGFGSMYPKKRTFISKDPYLIKDELALDNKHHNEEVLGVAEAIAKLGEDGWEMVGAVCDSTSSDKFGTTLYFKRPKE